MHIISEYRHYEDGIAGPAPILWYGPNALDGTLYPFSVAPIGSIYLQTGAQLKVLQKVDDVERSSAWASLGGMGVIVERVTRAEFTDGGSAVGTLDLAQKIPAGAWVQRVLVTDVTGFAGNVSAVLDVGTATDDDRYNTASGINVFADAVALDGGAPSGTQVHTSEVTVRLTLTSDSDFTSVSAGAATVKIFYLY